MLELPDHIARMFQERKLPPQNSFRVWLHTHPGNSPSPSSTDREEFNKLLAMGQPWLVMLIIAQDLSIHGEVGFKVGDEYLRGDASLQVDWSLISDEPIDVDALEKEYDEMVSTKTFSYTPTVFSGYPHSRSNWDRNYQEINWGERPNLSPIQSKNMREAHHEEMAWDYDSWGRNAPEKKSLELWDAVDEGEEEKTVDRFYALEKIGEDGKPFYVDEEGYLLDLDDYDNDQYDIIEDHDDELVVTQYEEVEEE